MDFKCLSFRVIKLILPALVFTLTACTTLTNKPVICNQEYALCTSARCIPDPRHSGYAICDCVVEKGTSVGFSNCTTRAPVKTQYQTQQITSTFSFAQFSSKKSLTCPQGFWTNCVDSPCTIDPINHKHAICNCPIEASQSYMTFGGDCKMNTCTTGFWSGASKAVSTSLQSAMLANSKNNPTRRSCAKAAS
jgi:hypothetical protein